MDESSHGDMDTRERLIRVAAEVFAEQGYRQATVRDICTRAGANIAAVNYHFGGKEGIYREAFDYAYSCAAEEFDIEDPVGTGAPEEQLEHFIEWQLSHVLCRGRATYLGRMMGNELVDPSPLIDYVVDNVLRPRVDWLRSITAALLGPAATEEDIRRCHLSVTSQCAVYHQNLAFLMRIYPDLKLDESATEDLARHIRTFSLAGIEAIRREVEA